MFSAYWDGGFACFRSALPVHESASLVLSMISAMPAALMKARIGMVLSLIFEWPAQLGGGSGKPNITAEEFILNGTVLSLPVGPWIVLIVCALLARSRRWWGTVAVVVLCLLGVMFIFGGLGETFAPDTPFVPRAVLVAAGVVYGGLGLALVITGISDLRNRWRTKRRLAM